MGLFLPGGAEFLSASSNIPTQAEKTTYNKKTKRASER